jgi:hypothetical protein
LRQNFSEAAVLKNMLESAEKHVLGVGNSEEEWIAWL